MIQQISILFNIKHYISDWSWLALIHNTAWILHHHIWWNILNDRCTWFINNTFFKETMLLSLSIKYASSIFSISVTFAFKFSICMIIFSFSPFHKSFSSWCCVSSNSSLLLLTLFLISIWLFPFSPKHQLFHLD